MKKNILYALGALIPMCAMLFTGCDNKIPDPKEIPLVSATLDISGMFPDDYPLMELGQTVDISNKMTLFPADATDRAQTFFTTDPTIASINGLGVITANSLGTVTITVYVGHENVHDSFELNIVDVIPIPTEELTLTKSNVTVGIYKTTDVNVKSLVMLIPDNANDGQTYTIASGDEGIASVTEDGLLSGIASGTATLTVASKNDPEINATLTVEVVEYFGWYYRSVTEGAYKPWGMIASQDPIPAITDCGQGILSAFDGLANTNFALTQPGKTTGGVTVVAGGNVWFIVDMQAGAAFNKVRIWHRDPTGVKQVRIQGFDYIAGSNDGIDFVTIATNVSIPNVNDNGDYCEFNISNTTPYRYIKFYCETSALCFSTLNGGSIQMKEIYLGYFEP